MPRSRSRPRPEARTGAGIYAPEVRGRVAAGVGGCGPRSGGCGQAGLHLSCAGLRSRAIRGTRHCANLVPCGLIPHRFTCREIRFFAISPHGAEIQICC